jgi:isoamylase
MGILGNWFTRRFTILLLLVVIWTTIPCRGRGQGFGASFDATLANITFRLYSLRATRVEVWIYAKATGEDERARYQLQLDPETQTWSKTVSVQSLRDAGVTGPVLYGYRAWGPNWRFDETWTKGSAAGFLTDVDDDGNRFNPNRLLLDPYAREVTHEFRTPAMPDGSLYQSGPSRTKDSGWFAPKGIVLPSTEAGLGEKPVRAFKDEIIYEVHLRGLTMNDPSVPPAERGT